MKKYEKEYIETLNRMDSRTLAQYTGTYIKTATELQERLGSVILEINMMHKLLMKKLEEEKK